MHFTPPEGTRAPTKEEIARAGDATGQLLPPEKRFSGAIDGRSVTGALKLDAAPVARIGDRTTGEIAPTCPECGVIINQHSPGISIGGAHDISFCMGLASGRRAALEQAAELCDGIALAIKQHPKDPRAAYQSAACKCAWYIRALTKEKP